jgi:molybdenum cofactor sulfurtransferase
MPSIPLGLNLLRSYLPLLPTRLAALTHFLATQLASLTHLNGAPAARVLSRVPGSIPTIGGAVNRRLPRVRDTNRTAIQLVPDSTWQSEEDRDGEGTGGTVSFAFLEPNGDMVPLSCVAASAAASGVMLRTGCMCNPGGGTSRSLPCLSTCIFNLRVYIAAALLGLSPFMSELRDGATLSQLEEAAGYELGVVRVSFGLVSNFEDAWAVTCWARKSVAESWQGFRDANVSGCYLPPTAM